MTPKNILIIKHGAFGDMLQADGSIQDIKAHFKNSKIILLTTPTLEILYKKSPFVDSIIIDKRSSLFNIKTIFKFLTKIKNNKIDLVIDLQNSTRTRIYKFFLMPNISWISTFGDKKSVSGYLGQVEMLKKENIYLNKTYNPCVNWMVGNIDKQLKKLKIKKGYIALIPGSSEKNNFKRWPYYNKLYSLLKNSGFNVVVLIGPEDKKLKNDFNEYVIEPQTLLELAGYIDAASFVFGNDSGPTFLASYLNKFGRGIFGPQNPGRLTNMIRGNFKAIEAENMKFMKPEDVFQIIKKDLKYLP